MSDASTPISGLDRWEQRYLDGDLPWDVGRPDEHLLRVLAEYEVAPARALDVGCGTATNVAHLAKRGHEVVGVDLSPTAIELGRAKVAAADLRCTLLAADFLTDPIPGGPFEFAYDRGCFHVFDEHDVRARFAERVAELLAPAGIWHSLIGSTDGPPRDTGPPRRSAADVCAAVEPFFELLELRSTVFDNDHSAEARAWVMVARRRE